MALQRTYNIIKGFLFTFLNKEFLIFLCFLALSAIFWFLTAYNETYEKDIAIPLELVNVPDNVIITDDIPDTIHITVRDKGYAIMTYYYGNMISPVKVNFSTYASTIGHGSVSQADLAKLIYPMLFNSTKITQVKVDKVDFYYSYGISKRVPIIFDGEVTPAETYYVSDITMSPDSVTIYANKDILSKIKEVYTCEYNLKNITDTTINEARLRKIRGVKMVPETIKLHFACDVLTEKEVTVPITCINMASGFVVRTFPSSVQVKVVVGKRNLDTVVPENFRVVVDYNQVKDHPTDKCQLVLKTVPRDIQSATLETQQVDYLIEALE